MQKSFISQSFRKILATVIVISLAILSYGGQLDKQAESSTERSLTRALTAFGVARALNGVISVAQGTEFAVQPAGIGVVFTPGQILDPINDLVERFSWVMLAASTSLGIQKTILVIAKWPYFSCAITALLILVALKMWQVPIAESIAGPQFFKIVFVLLLLRFGVIILAIGSEVVFSEFLSAQYESASAELEMSTDKIGRLNTSSYSAPTTSNSNSWMDRATELYHSAASTLNVSAQIEQYKTAAGDATRSAVDLVVVFVFQTILLPLVFFLVLKGAARNLLRAF